MFSWRNAESIWSNFHEEFFKLTADWSTLVRSSSWSLVSWDTLSAFPQSMRLCSAPRVLHAHMIQFPRKWFFLVRERRSHTLENPGTQTAESLLLGPQVHPDLVNLLERLCSFFPPNSPVALSPLLSLWDAFQSSPTQTLTQALGSYFFPNAHNTFIFQAASSVRKVDYRHPLIQTPAVSAESVQLAQCRVLPRRRLRISN